MGRAKIPVFLMPGQECIRASPRRSKLARVKPPAVDLSVGPWIELLRHRRIEEDERQKLKLHGIVAGPP